MVTIDEFSRLVAAIYSSAVDPDHWVPALAEVCRAVDATGAGLLIGDRTTRRVLSANVPPEARETYSAYYHHIDYVLAAVEIGAVGLVRSGSELVALNAGSEFDADWMRPYQMDDGLFVRLTNGAMPTCFIVAGPKRSEPFETPERVKLVDALVPHLQQALHTQRELSTLARRGSDLAEVLNAVRHGIITVKSDGWVIDLNTAAERVLRAEDGMQLRSARITATSMKANRKLQCALDAALADDGSMVRGGRSFVCNRPSGKRPYVVHVLPLHRIGAGEIASEARALVVIVDSENEPETAAALVRRLYGLTVAEAEVAVRLTGGTSLADIADGLSVSYQTVRTHLQHIFDKTDTHRQAELVRLLLTTAP
ncbi:MAG TPA: helix-turn-helix transcriptional regulator [Mycobacterium sp.]|nr:helix-turn-helix transcriptional regulator [Mycobacterium sp.]